MIPEEHRCWVSSPRDTLSSSPWKGGHFWNLCRRFSSPGRASSVTRLAVTTSANVRWRFCWYSLGKNPHRGMHTTFRFWSSSVVVVKIWFNRFQSNSDDWNCKVDKHLRTVIVDSQLEVNHKPKSGTKEVCRVEWCMSWEFLCDETRSAETLWIYIISRCISLIP